MQFKDILKILRKKKGLTQQELADKVGVEPSTVGKWEQVNYIPNKDILFQLCEIFNVTTDYLLGRKVDNNIEFIEVDTNIIKIPVYGFIPAGVPIEMIEDVLEYIDIPASWAYNNAKFFGLKITGDSMLPKFESEDVIIFRRQSTCENGQFAAVSINGTECTFKKIIKHNSGITLQPLNPTYEPVFFNNEQIEKMPITILGVYVQLRRNG